MESIGQIKGENHMFKSKLDKTIVVGIALIMILSAIAVFAYGTSQQPLASANGKVISINVGDQKIPYYEGVRGSNSVGALTSDASSQARSSRTGSSLSLNSVVSTSSDPIYSEVNATSSNIFLYSLPGAEEFTVGSSNETVNYFVLYLSGSGTVDVSIGSSLFHSDVLSNTTVTVTPGKFWYNMSFKPTTLTGSTGYYLNVFPVSGSVEWGYTTSPSIAKNNLQDFYYVSGVLAHDNASPNIYTIGFAAKEYTVTFTETGLSLVTSPLSGSALSVASWSVTLNGVTENSTTNTITFSEPNGAYPFTVGSITGYTASPSSGTVTVNGASVNVNITFTPVSVKTYSVTFTESGLSLLSSSTLSVSWSVTLNGVTENSTTNTITFKEPNGTYSFTVGSITGYTASPSSGTVTVNGASVSQTITFTHTVVSSVVYSEVNATSSNIFLYSLPGAEEFTVGSSNETVNYFVLYLSGSGTVDVSIGSSLFHSDVLSNTTVTVTPGKFWYNMSFKPTTLTGSTGYYLNVFPVSGSVEWGYTTSPSIAKNNLQDFYYVSGVLAHDNASPNIYTIGFTPVPPQAVLSQQISNSYITEFVFAVTLTLSFLGIVTLTRRLK